MDRVYLRLSAPRLLSLPACVSLSLWHQTLLGDGSVVVVEYPVELGSLPATIGPRLVGMRNRKYGRTMMAVYCINPVLPRAHAHACKHVYAREQSVTKTGLARALACV